jgi:hypothetical protein
MLDDLGSTLTAVLRDRLPAGTAIRLDPPSESWSGPTATIGLYLHRVLENPADGSTGLWTEDRDADGRVVRRAASERQYDFCYLVTAWAADPEQELALLGGVLRAVANDGPVPAGYLAGSLAEARSPVTLAVGAAGRPSAAPEIWTALGLHPRISLDLVVTAAVAPIVRTELAPPPHAIELDVAAPGSGLTTPATPSRRPRPTARITEGGHRAQSGSQAG